MFGRGWPFLLLLLFSSSCSEELQVIRGDAVLQVDPTEVDFGDVAIGLQHRVELELRNPGEVPLSITAMLSAELGGEFTLEATPDQLSAGGRTIATLSFAPTSPGLRDGTLLFTTDSPSQPTVEVHVKGRGVPPALVAEPPVLDFGRVIIGKTATLAVALTNTADFQIEVVRAQLEASGEFSIDVQRTRLDPGQRLDLVVTYTPGDIGIDEGRIIVIDNSPRAEALGVRLRGEGVDSDILVEPARLTFSMIYVGQTQTQSFTIRNLGDRAHEVSEVLFSSSRDVTAGELEIDPLSLPSRSFTLAPNQTRQIDVVFRPIDAGADVDSIRVVSSGLVLPATVQLDAITDAAPVPRIQVMPAALAFGQVEVSQSRPLDVTISNAGTANLQLTADLRIDPATAPFTLQNAPANGFTYAPTDNTTFQVVFTAPAAGPTSAELVIASNDPATPEVRVPLGGEGINTQVPAIFVSPNPLDFGRVPRATNASRSILVRNDGTAPLVLSMVRLTNDAGGRFRLPAPPAPSTTLAPAQQLNFNVDYFDNGVVASYNGALEIQSNDPGGSVTVPLTAATDPPPPQLTDISITLTWSSTVADIDLHFIRPGGDFFDSPSDNCWCNTNPDWGSLGQPGDNPFLDRDDLRGPGPENINLSSSGNGEHQVVAHYFASHGAGDVLVTVEVRVRGILIATRSETLAEGERWIAGRVNWSTAVNAGTWTDGFLGPFPTIYFICF